MHTPVHQIYVKLLILVWAASCLATEKKPYYEHLYDPESIFHVEDYHADLVLGMLPEIKTSIKHFRKRNFTSSDIENMYQTLTIFWPVVRKYLHLKEDLVDVPSQSNENYTQIASNEIVQSQLSQASPLSYKNDHLISPHIKSDTASTSNNQKALSRNKPNSPSTQRNSNRRNFGVKIKRIRPSLAINDNKRNVQRTYPNRNMQSKTTINQSVTTAGRPFTATSDKPLSTTTRRPFRPTPSRLLRPRVQKPVTAYSSSPAGTDSRSVSTSSSRPIPSAKSSVPIERTTSRSQPSVLKNSAAKNPPKHLTKQVDLSGKSNSTQDNEAETFKTPVSDAMSYYRGFSNILKIIGTPIDLSDVNG